MRGVGGLRRAGVLNLLVCHEVDSTLAVVPMGEQDERAGADDEMSGCNSNVQRTKQSASPSIMPFALRSFIAAWGCEATAEVLRYESARRSIMRTDRESPEADAMCRA